MESVLENVDKDKERALRSSARIERMRREKQRQMRQRRMLKKYFRLGIAFLGLVVIIVTSVSTLGKKSKTSEAQFPIEQGEQLGTAQPSDEAEGQALLPLRQVDGEGLPETEAGMKEETPVYSFEATSATRAMNSEEIISTNAILVDESKDIIIASKGERKRISPASMTKVLTVLVAAEHLTEGELDDTFMMTREITDYGYINGCSSVGFLDGEKVTVRDLFYGTILPSGSDAAVGLATYVAGSHEAFVELMNEKLEEMGLSDSAHFTNCVGIYDEDHYCTVYDMAVIMKAALRNDLCKSVLSAHNYTTAPTAEHPEGLNISNWFLRRIEDKDTGGEVLCAKTGYVTQSRNCAVSYGTFADGGAYICVSAGATSAWKCIYDHVKIYNQYIQA